MNLQSVRSGSINVSGDRRRRNNGKSCNYGGFIVKFILVIIAFMGVLVGHLYLRQQSVKSAERTDDIKKQLMDVKAENCHLRNSIEELKNWTHISRKIAQFKLPLVQAAFGQIITIGVYTPEQAARIPLTPLKVASTAAVQPRGR